MKWRKRLPDVEPTPTPPDGFLYHPDHWSETTLYWYDHQRRKSVWLKGTWESEEARQKWIDSIPRERYTG